MRKLLLVAGTRPNLVKAAPIIKAGRLSDVVYVEWVWINQHYSDIMSSAIAKSLNMPKPDYECSLFGDQLTSLARMTDMMTMLGSVIEKAVPDAVIVLGDCDTAVAGAMAAHRLGVHVVHVEAGLRSDDITMVEEVNRRLVDNLSYFLFASELSGFENLSRERVQGLVSLVGNVMVDSLFSIREAARDLEAWATYGALAFEYVLFTAHRPSLVDTREGIGRMIKMLRVLTSAALVIFPVHPRTQKSIKEHGFEALFRSFPNLVMIDAVDYLDFVSLMTCAGVVVTDSGGVQEETSALGVSCLTIRENTERPITIEQGTNELVGTKDIEKFTSSFLSAWDCRHMTSWRSIPLWDGSAADRIVNELETYYRSLNNE